MKWLKRNFGKNWWVTQHIMDDKELLEYAALAMGFEPHVEYDEDYGLTFIGGDEHGTYLDHWNPLVYHLERWHLIETLRLGIDFDSQEVWKWMPHGKLLQEYWGDNHYDEAHAVLMVAAQMGIEKLKGNK